MKVLLSSTPAHEKVTRILITNSLLAWWVSQEVKAADKLERRDLQKKRQSERHVAAIVQAVDAAGQVYRFLINNKQPAAVC